MSALKVWKGIMRKKPVAHTHKFSQEDIRDYFQQCQCATLTAKKYAQEKQGRIASVLVGLGYLVTRIQSDLDETGKTGKVDKTGKSDKTSFFIINLRGDRDFFMKVSRLAIKHDWDDFIFKSPGVDMDALLKDFAARKRLKYNG